MQVPLKSVRHETKVSVDSMRYAVRKQIWDAVGIKTELEYGLWMEELRSRVRQDLPNPQVDLPAVQIAVREIITGERE
jgi:hypothetical protein